MVHKQAVEIWMSVVSQIKHETDGFKLDLSKLNDRELVCMRFVTQAMIDFAPIAIKAVKPKEVPNLKNAIVYLIDMRDRQILAWEREEMRWYDQLKRVNAWINKRQQHGQR